MELETYCGSFTDLDHYDIEIPDLKVFQGVDVDVVKEEGPSVVEETFRKLKL